MFGYEPRPQCVPKISKKNTLSTKLSQRPANLIRYYYYIDLNLEIRDGNVSHRAPLELVYLPLLDNVEILSMIKRIRNLHSYIITNAARRANSASRNLHTSLPRYC